VCPFQSEQKFEQITPVKLYARESFSFVLNPFDVSLSKKKKKKSTFHNMHEERSLPKVTIVKEVYWNLPL
jgi:hypothetical protein